MTPFLINNIKNNRILVFFSSYIVLHVYFYLIKKILTHTYMHELTIYILNHHFKILE